MLIDWFTVVAQALNFLILVWLLKRFLYKPILDAIDAREKRIAAELADADAKKAEAGQERDEFTRKNEEFDQQRTALLTKAEDEATAERQRLLGQARKESDTLRTKWQEALRSEHQSLSEELTRRTREEVFAIARKTLADLATTSLEEQMTEVPSFAGCANWTQCERRATVGALKAASDSSDRAQRVRPACGSASRRLKVWSRTCSALRPNVQFETAPDLVSGIELTANGHKVAWSIGHYLASLKKSVDELLKERPNPTANADAPPEQPANEHDEPENLQNVFDRAFSGISQARESFSPELTPHEVGRITNVSTGIARVSGLPRVGFEEVLKFPGDVYGIAFNVDEDEIGVVLLGDYSQLHAGDEVGRRGHVMDVPVGDD